MLLHNNPILHDSVISRRYGRRGHSGIWQPLDATGQTQSLPPSQAKQSATPKTYAQATAPTRVSPNAPLWFRFNHIPLPPRAPSVVDNDPACLFTPVEIDQSTKQFENALIMKFSAGRPMVRDMQLHIKLNWGLSKEPVVSLIDPRHVLIVPASYHDMELAQSHEVHKIEACMFRLFRWTKDSAKIARLFQFGFVSHIYQSFISIRRICKGLEIQLEYFFERIKRLLSFNWLSKPAHALNLMYPNRFHDVYLLANIKNLVFGKN